MFKKIAFLIVVFVLTAARCAKDSEEQNTDGTQEYFETLSTMSKDSAEADWKGFRKTAGKLIAITQSNLITLDTKISKEKGDYQAGYDEFYGKCEYDLSELLAKLSRRDLEFARELKHYNGSSVAKNKEFKNNFINEMQQLNDTLESVIKK